MVHDVKSEIRKFSNLDELSASAAKEINDLINEVVSRKGRFTIALSGGNTPRLLHHYLATTYRDSIPWNSVQIFFGDERYVSHDDKQSNYLMVKETLLDLISIPLTNIHSIPTSFINPNEAAQDYEKRLRKIFSDTGNTFDLVLLGMGKEGHTASLFPNSPVLDEKERWVIAVEAPAIPKNRITLTFPILNRASEIYFLVSGAEKAEALGAAVNRISDFHACPAAGVHPSNGNVVWWVDSTAYED
ncbi:MAG: 6-phosphogluconolactonase [Bacteroidetes bacterium]|nr:6-phosphogluconolactonase [Bacteroidota bacterium]